MLMSIELILNSVNLNFIAFNKYLWPNQMDGLFFTLFIIAIAAAEAAASIAGATAAAAAGSAGAATSAFLPQAARAAAAITAAKTRDLFIFRY